MPKVIHTAFNAAQLKKKKEHEFYQYAKQTVTPRNEFDQVHVAFYCVEPQKAAYPLHYHEKNTEVFYIIQGSGQLETKDGVQEVGVGDLLVFPPGEEGVHRLINHGTTNLIYLDVDTVHSPDTVQYPHSHKIGKIVHNQSAVFYQNGVMVDYYKDE